MSYDIIKQLAEKYYNGKTSLQEEKKLKELLFASEQLTDELLSLKAEFMALDEMASEQLDDSFDLKIMKAISKTGNNENEKTIRLINSRSRKTPLVYKLSAVAAVIVILLTVWSTENFFTSKKAMFDNQKSLLAYQQATKALEILAVNFDKGLSRTQQAVQPLNTGLNALGNVKMIDKGINTLRPVEKLKSMKIGSK